jgi:hypothetical protein
MGIHFLASEVLELSLVTIPAQADERTGEAASALLFRLAAMLAMSLALMRSPTAIRKSVDELGKRLAPAPGRCRGQRRSQGLRRSPSSTVLTRWAA